MYKLDIYVTNPMGGDNRLLRYQLDPATFNQKSWDARYSDIQAAVNDLLSAAATPTRPDLAPTTLQ